MPTHANATDDTGVAAFGGHPCIVNKIGMCWHGVGLPKSMLWLVRPLTFAGEALAYLLVQQIGYICQIRIIRAEQQ